MSSNIDDHVRRRTPAGQRGDSPHQPSQESGCGLRGWKASPGSGASVDIDVSLTRTRTSGWRRVRCAWTEPPEKETSEGSIRRSDVRLKRPRRSPFRSPPTGEAPRVRARLPARKVARSVDPKPAARRQARGCRRPDDRKVVRRRSRRGEQPVVGRSRRRTSAGFPTALGERSPKVKSRRVLVT